MARDAQPPLKTNDKQAIPQSPVLNEDMLQFLEEVSAHNRGYLKHKLAFAVLLKFGGCKSLTQVGYLFYVLQNFQRAIKFQTTSWSII